MRISKLEGNRRVVRLYEFRYSRCEWCPPGKGCNRDQSSRKGWKYYRKNQWRS